MRRKPQLTVLPGDGAGPEALAGAIKILFGITSQTELTVSEGRTFSEQQAVKK